MARAARKNANTVVEAASVEATENQTTETTAIVVAPVVTETPSEGVETALDSLEMAWNNPDENGEKIEWDFARFNNSSTLDEGIKSLYIVGDTSRKLSHELVVASIQHYITSGDYTRLLRVFDAVKYAQGNSRETALRAYVTANVPTLIVSDAFDGKKKIGVKLTHIKGEARRFIAAELNKLGKPFWLLEKGAPTIDFNFLDAMKTLLKRSIAANTNVGNHKPGEDVYNDEGALVKRIGKDYVNISTAQANQLAEMFKIDLAPAK